MAGIFLFNVMKIKFVLRTQCHVTKIIKDNWEVINLGLQILFSLGKKYLAYGKQIALSVLYAEYMNYQWKIILITSHTLY